MTKTIEFEEVELGFLASVLQDVDSRSTYVNDYVAFRSIKKKVVDACAQVVAAREGTG